MSVSDAEKPVSIQHGATRTARMPLGDIYFGIILQYIENAAFAAAEAVVDSGSGIARWIEETWMTTASTFHHAGDRLPIQPDGTQPVEVAFHLPPGIGCPVSAPMARFIAELCRKEGIAQSPYYTWSKEFMEAGKRRFSGDTARAATVADLTLENRLLKKSMIAPHW